MSHTQPNTKGETMSYSRACEILGFTTPKSLAANARLAESARAAMTVSTPLRFKIAADVVIAAAK